MHFEFTFTIWHTVLLLLGMCVAQSALIGALWRSADRQRLQQSDDYAHLLRRIRAIEQKDVQ